MHRLSAPLALYIHWPFCKAKCPYCDFNSHVAATINHDDWRRCYRTALKYYAEQLPDSSITSVFFGGGTPSLMEPQTIHEILDNIAQHWRIDDNVEITLEANPTSAEAEKFAAFRAAGVNRLSLGVQALNDQDLKFLGREHNTAEAHQAIAWTQKYFMRSSFDLIYARHGQTVAAWEKELRQALTIMDGHLSLYQLTIEPTTQFYTLSQRGVKLTAPDDEAATMYELTQAMTREAGLPAYEISNHARIGQASRHNLTYWQYQNYIGIGPGAHGRYVRHGVRYATDDHRAPDVWLRQVAAQGYGIREITPIDDATAMREALMMGLRLNEGISCRDWQEKFGVPLNAFLDAEKIQKLAQEAYLIFNGEKLMATATGLQRLNAVLDYLLN